MQAQGAALPMNPQETLVQQKATLFDYTSGVHDQTGFDNFGKMLKYNHKKVASMRALCLLSNTVFTSGFLIKHFFLYLVFAALVAISTNYATTLEQSDSEQLSPAVSSLNTVLGFMLGLYISTMMGRWWSIRNNCIGNLWGSIDDLCLILAAHMPDPQDRIFKQRILRLCALSFALCFHQAQGLESVQDLLHLVVDRGLLMPEELAVIKDKPSKPQLVWVWIMQLLHALADKGKIRNKGYLEPKLDFLCTRARGAIGEIFAYLDTQVPFTWVHMLSVTVTVTNLVTAFRGGLSLGFMLQHQSWTAKHLFSELINIVVLPLAFHSFLLIGSELDNPLGDDFIDFPGWAYHRYMLKENAAFFEVGEETPHSVLGDLVDVASATQPSAQAPDGHETEGSKAPDSTETEVSKESEEGVERLKMLVVESAACVEGMVAKKAGLVSKLDSLSEIADPAPASSSCEVGEGTTYSAEGEGWQL